MEKTKFGKVVFAACVCAAGLAWSSEAPRWLNVPPLLEGHEEEIAADQRWLYENTIVDSSAFIVTLTPEGDPVFDKAAVYLPRLKKMKALLKGAKGKFGIQFQATMGHGWVPDSMTPWQKIVGPDGEEPYVFCPLGQAFRSYLQEQVGKLAEIRPDFFMVDDDTRFITGRDGCFCPLHLAEMEKRTGRAWTRESLVAALKTDTALAHVYDKLLEDSIVGLVQIVRAAFDNVDPSIAGTFCCCACDVRHATRIARAVAASGQRPVLRLNNGRYCREDARAIPGWLHKTALQLSTIDSDVVVLDEPDTCPQNRYSMSARDFHCHLAMSILEGCHGAKIWVTRMGQWEPKSGVAYREALAAHRGLYAALAELSPTWEGVRIPLPAKGYFSLKSYWDIPNWGGDFLGRAGIAYANAKASMPLAALTGGDAAMLTDADIRGLLAGKLILDGAGAKALAARGFSKEIGCRVEDWTGPVVSFEVLADGTHINAKPEAVKLVDINPKATVLSTYHHRDAALAKDSTLVGLGAIKFANALGGEVIVVADMLPRNVDLGSFHFYNETRKAQILNFLQQLGYVAPYYSGDAEILIKWGRDKDGNRLLVVLDTGHDDLEELPLVFPDGNCPQTAERLGDDGVWHPVGVRREGSGRVTLNSPVRFINPAVFRFSGMSGDAGECERPVFETCRVSAVPFNRQWPGHQRELSQTAEARYVQLEADGRTRWIDVGDAKIPAMLLPLSEADRLVSRDGRWRLRVDCPADYVVDFGTAAPAVQVFVQPPWKYDPRPGDIRFGPGEHVVGRCAYSNSNVRVVLDRGAIVRGSFQFVGGTNVAVVGRGTIDCERAGDRSYGGPFSAHMCRNVTLEGVVLKNSSGFNVNVDDCDGVTIDGIKIVGAWRYNSDGIDVCASRDTVVRNCYIRSYDDCVVARGCCPWVSDAPLSRMTVSNCVLWCDWGKNCEVWAGSRANVIEDVTFRGNKLIRCAGIPMDVTTWFGSSNTVIRNVLFEDQELDLEPRRLKLKMQAYDGEPYIPEYQDFCIVGNVDCAGVGPENANEVETAVDADVSKYRLDYANIRFSDIRVMGSLQPLRLRLVTDSRYHVLRNVTFDRLPPGMVIQREGPRGNDPVWQTDSVRNLSGRWAACDGGVEKEVMMPETWTNRTVTLVVACAKDVAAAFDGRTMPRKVRADGSAAFELPPLACGGKHKLTVSSSELAPGKTYGTLYPLFGCIELCAPAAR